MPVSLWSDEPFVKPVKLAAFGRRIVEQTQQHVNRVKNDELRAHLDRLRLQRREQPGEVERASLHHIGPQAGVDEINLLLLKRAHVPAKGLPVGRHPARILLKCNKDARRAVMRSGANQRLESEDRFPGTRTTHQQRRPPERQSAAGDVVESLDSARYFLKNRRVLFFGHSVSVLLLKSEACAGLLLRISGLA